jgi:hypothetical protein
MATNSSVNMPTDAAGKIWRAQGVGSNSAFSQATYPDTAGSSGNVLTSDGTNWLSSAPPSGAGLLSVSWTLTNAQIKALRATPVTIVAAPGAGKVVVPVSSFAKMIYGGTNVFTAGASQQIAGGCTLNSMITVMVNSSITAASTNYNIASSASGGLANAITQYQNTAFNLFNTSATEITGNAAANNTMAGTLIYYIATI